MRFNTLKYLIYALPLLNACREEAASSFSLNGLKPDTTVKYAKRFSIAHGGNFKVVYLMGNRNNFDTTAIFILGHNKEEVKLIPPGASFIQVPCRKMAVLSSIYASMMAELGEVNGIAAIDNMDYVNNNSIIEKHKKTPLPEIARTPQVDIEKTVRVAPDIIFTFGMGDGKDVDEKLKLTGIPVAISVDHLEGSPLARAEWIKFFAAFVERDHEADSIFRLVERNYTRLKKLGEGSEKKPTVFNETKFGDTWYMPGGRSYIATLLEDAGANYLWRNDSSAGSLPLSFEQVFAKARDADFWINLSTITSRKELAGYEDRYTMFKAFKNGNLYNNNKVMNSKGYSTYWETGMIHPDRILHDMIRIFHPEIEVPGEQELYYYRQLK